MRRRALRLALVLAGLVVGCAAAELAARVVRPDAAADLLFDAPGNVPDGMYVADAELGYSPNPGFRGVLRSLGYSVPIRFNTLGLRGEEPAAGVEPAWLVLGDSFTLSAQVPEEETFVGRLDAGPGRFWNGGVDGYSTWHALVRYRRAAALDPVGVVLVYFLGNDPADDERFANGIHMRPGARAGEPLPALKKGDPVTAFLAQRSFLYGQARVWSRRRAFAAGQGADAERWRNELSVFTTAGASQLPGLLSRGSGRALQALRDEVARRGDRLVVALAPPAFVVMPERQAATFSLVGLDPRTADVDAPARVVGEELRRLDVASCDLTGPLRAATTGPLYFTYDGHWTPAGHAVVAEAIAGCLR